MLVVCQRVIVIRYVPTTSVSHQLIIKAFILQKETMESSFLPSLISSTASRWTNGNYCADDNVRKCPVASLGDKSTVVKSEWRDPARSIESRSTVAIISERSNDGCVA